LKKFVKKPVIAVFNGEKMLTLRGRSRCEICGGNWMRMISFWMQWLRNSVEIWLSWPSHIN